MRLALRWRLIAFFVVVVALVLTLIPFIWTILTSLKTFRDIMETGIVFEPTFKNYSALFFRRGSDFPAYVRNSVIVGLSATFICLFCGSLAAYSVSRFRFPLKIGALVLAWTIVLHMIHPMALVLPIFVQLRTMGLYDSHLGLILVYATRWIPVSLWMMKGFIDDISLDLEDSALIDGASRFQTLRRIVLPLVAPGLAATTIFVFIFIWNEFTFALILTSSAQTMTLPVGISRLAQQYFIRYGEMSAASIFSTIPVFILVWLAQKQIVRGLTFGAVKG